MEQYFQLLNNYFNKVYVLSVESAEARRKLFEERFKGLGYEFFYGADKNKFNVEEIEQKNIFSEKLTRQHHRFSKTMRPGEIACSWSHKMMYEQLLSHNWQRILIFEDDAVPDPQRMKDIPDILNEIPTDCELLMWGWDKNGLPPPAAGLKQFVYHLQHSIGKLKWDHKVIRHLYARPFSPHLKRAGFHDYTYAYSLTRLAAEKLVRMQTPIQYIADNLLAHASTKQIVNGYITWPAVFLHDNLADGTHRDSYIR
jgi:glycosyl transferase family 25